MTPSPAASALPGTPADDECAPPRGWIEYRVRSGDTLFEIALAVRSTIGALRDANCLEDVDTLVTAQRLYVPREPADARTTRTPGAPSPGGGSVNLAPEGCSDLNSIITAPRAGQPVGGVFTLSGNAARANFAYYKIEVRPASSAIYNFYDRFETPVLSGTLGQVNTGLFGSGVHWVRLTVVDSTGNYAEPCAIPVVFR